MTRRAWIGCAAAAAALLAAPMPAAAQDESPPIGREAALELDYPRLDFDPPEARQHELSNGVQVLHLEDRTLPLVDIVARFRGGYALFDREDYAAATALPSLLRSGGTEALPPDSVDALLEFYALQTSWGSAGEASFSSLNVLTSHLDVGLELWGSMLRTPRFDPAQVAVWQGQEMESVRRRKDDPARLAFSEFNRLMFGDHPIGWEMTPEDLGPAALAPPRLHRLHRRIFCPGNLVLGVSGDVSWEEIEPRLEALVEGWGPCPGPLPEPRIPQIRREPGVFLIPRDLSQSTVVMAHPTSVRQGLDPDYFASRIGHSILGGSGFTSRILSRVRTEEGFAYSASSLWTAPRENPGIVGALTRTRSETTIAATRLILEIMEEMRREAPGREEVRTAIDEIVNGFVFNFEDPSQIVSRTMSYVADDYPEDWLERYVEGIQEVDPDDVRDVFAEHLRPQEMTILILGDPEAFDEDPSVLGPVRIWEVEDPFPPDSASSPPRSEGAGTGITPGGSPSGWPRSPR